MTCSQKSPSLVAALPFSAEDKQAVFAQLRGHIDRVSKLKTPAAIHRAEIYVQGLVHGLGWVAALRPEEMDDFFYDLDAAGRAARDVAYAARPWWAFWRSWA